ncbi:MAG: nuclear transport factor 2 family protein [Flavobacteriales bacterium]|nr:nuclear transport factor 2 family protein [Flavobacteriales bacterium]
MNKAIITLLLVLICCFASAQSTKVLAEEQIKLVMKFQESNWNMGNIPAYMKGYWNSDSLLFVGSKGPTYGYQKTLMNYLKSYPSPEKMGQLTFDFVKINILSYKDAFVVGKWQLDRKDDVLKGYFSLLWKKIEGEWKIVADHSSSE